MILIIRVVYALLIVSTINTLLFFWPLTFFFGWSFVSYKFLLFTTNKAWDYIRNIVVFDKQEKQQQIKQKKSKFDSEEERKLYYLTKFNTIINKTLPENIDKQADMSKQFFLKIMNFFFVKY